VVAITSFWDERKLLVFVALIIVASVAMLLEVNAARRGARSISDQVVSSVITPVEHVVTQAASATAVTFHNLTHAGSFAAENSALQNKIHALSSANERLKNEALENKDLHKMLGLAQSMQVQTVAADVVGYAPENGRRQIMIDRGWRDGVRRDAVVINADGLVGRVIDVGGHDAHVLLIIDPTSSVPAFLRSTRSWGIAIGTWRNVRMKYISQDVKVLSGDTVITGRGEIYPGGLRIGTVQEIDRSNYKLYQTAYVRPAVNFDALTHVLVLKLQ